MTPSELRIGAPGWASHLRALTASDPAFWRRFSPVPRADLDALEAAVGRKLPEEYRLFLEEFGAGGRPGGHTLFTPDDVIRGCHGPMLMIAGSADWASDEDQRHFYATRGKSNPDPARFAPERLRTGGVSLLDLLQIGADGACGYLQLHVGEGARPFGCCVLTDDGVDLTYAGFSEALRAMLSTEVPSLPLLLAEDSKAPVVEEARARLEALHDEHRRLLTYRTGGPTLEDLARLRAISDEVVLHERRLHWAQGGEVALAWRWPVRPRGIEVAVLAGGTRTEVFYPAGDPRDPQRSIARVTFSRVHGTRLGDPNDEVVEAHPLHGRGLEVGGAHIVERSSWLAEVRRMNATHPQFEPAYWDRVRHYLLVFKEQVFECLATTVQGRVVKGPMAAALREATSSP